MTEFPAPLGLTEDDVCLIVEGQVIKLMTLSDYDFIEAARRFKGFRGVPVYINASRTHLMPLPDKQYDLYTFTKIGTVG